MEVANLLIEGLSAEDPGPCSTSTPSMRSFSLQQQICSWKGKHQRLETVDSPRLGKLLSQKRAGLKVGCWQAGWVRASTLFHDIL